MYYTIKLQDFIRVPPNMFDIPTKEAVLQQVKKKYDGYISQDNGVVIDVLDVDEINEGVIIAGDGASYFDTQFRLITFKPELQEVIR